MARGGRRQGAPGKAYSNRSDLNANANGPRKPYTPTVAPAGNQPHGAQANQLRSLAALPLATNPNTASTGSLAATGGTGATPDTGGIAPGQLPRLDRPTERPNEPVTTGIDSGPGAGSEVLPAAPITPDVSASMLIGSMHAQNPTSPELAQLATYVSGGRG